MKKKLSMLVACAMLLALLAACGGNNGGNSGSNGGGSSGSSASNGGSNAQSGQDSGKSDGDKIVIGAAYYDLTNNFYVNMMTAGEEAAEDFGVEVIFKSAEGSLDSEISIIENFIEQGVDCILVDPIDAAGVVPVFQEAYEAGIPIVSIGNFVDTEFNYNVLYNDYEDTYKIGKYVAEKIGGAGDVALIYGNSGNYVSDQRQAGFEAAMAEYPDISLVSQPADFDATKGMTVAGDLMNANPELKAIHSVSDGVSYGVLQAMQSAGKADSIMLTSYDGEQEASDLVSSGDIEMTLLTGSKRVGYWSVKIGAQLARGEDLPQKNYMPTYFVMGEEAEKMMVEKGIVEVERILGPAEGREMFDGYRADLGPDAD